LTSLNQTLIKVRNRKAVVLQLSPQHTGINLAPTS
jgi:hypothetical protein